MADTGITSGRSARPSARATGASSGTDNVRPTRAARVTKSDLSTGTGLYSENGPVCTGSDAQKRSANEKRLGRAGEGWITARDFRCTLGAMGLLLYAGLVLLFASWATTHLLLCLRLATLSWKEALLGLVVFPMAGYYGQERRLSKLTTVW